jgi:carbamoylphosphate synthase small subunit
VRLILEDGTQLCGVGFGAERPVVGEVVALTRKLREKGTVRGWLLPVGMNEEDGKGRAGSRWK